MAGPASLPPLLQMVKPLTHCYARSSELSCLSCAKIDSVVAFPAGLIFILHTCSPQAGEGQHDWLSVLPVVVDLERETERVREKQGRPPPLTRGAMLAMSQGCAAPRAPSAASRAAAAASCACCRAATWLLWIGAASGLRQTLYAPLTYFHVIRISRSYL